jgi:hypothetical protein
MVGAGAEVPARASLLVLRVLSPIPALCKSLPLHPDEERDPYVFLLDLPPFGIGYVPRRLRLATRDRRQGPSPRSGSLGAAQAAGRLQPQVVGQRRPGGLRHCDRGPQMPERGQLTGPARKAIGPVPRRFGGRRLPELQYFPMARTHLGRSVLNVSCGTSLRWWWVSVEAVVGSGALRFALVPGCRRSVLPGSTSCGSRRSTADSAAPTVPA